MNYLLYVSNEQITLYYTISILSAIITKLITGYGCRTIVSLKNYPPEMNHGFAWGFWLSAFGIIACVLKPNYFETYEGRQTIPNSNNMGYGTRNYNQYNANSATEEMVICACGARIGRTDKFCMVCGQKRDNSTKNQNITDNSSQPPQEAQKQSDTEVSVGILEWKCPSCGRINSKARSTCSKCNASRYSNHAPNNVPDPNTITDQLTELKSLLDNGLITEEEFNAKKKQILGL